MGEGTREIEHDLDRTRENLAGNFRELEDKVRSATDWKQYFDAHPALVLGVAFGGAVIIGHLLGGSRLGAATSPRPLTVNGVSHDKGKAYETLNILKAALMGLATVRLTEFVDSKLPGFADHYHRAETQSRTR